MALSPGTKLGPYEIVAPVGAGGMGEVYRARDSRLNRTVAVKVLSAEICANADFRQRFEREAQTISSLQHPNICTLHDIGTQNGLDFLVLEFVDGETLDKRLEKGPLSLELVLRYSAEIADALDKAHRRGIVHRDLKPGNIMLTKSGAKLLDFGLAKLQQNATELSSALTEVTVASQKLTARGTLVGTFQYMAPEQLEGKDADARSDIFALGAVIYEMAAGKPAFEAKSRASLIAAILSSEPAPISSVQPMTPPALDRVVKRCLAKDPDERWQSAGDLASELRWIAEGGSHVNVPAPVIAHRKNRERLAWAAVLCLVIAAALAGIFYIKSSEKAPNSIEAYLPPPDNTSYFFTGDAAGFPVISPQGDKVAFVAAGEQGARLLWVRSLLDGSAHSIAGTDNASLPFWSPDGKSIGYFAQGRMMRISVAGGVPADIAEVPNARGASWGRADVIVYTPLTQTTLFSVPASGGTPKAVTRIDAARHTTHRWPYFLPDGKHFLYLAASHTRPHAEFDAIYVGSLDSQESRMLTVATSNAIAVPGHLIFMQGTTLMAQSFDEDSATLSGDPFVVAQNVHFEEGNWRGVFDCSPDGTLIYQSAGAAHGSQLAWYSRDGQVLGKLGESDLYNDLRLSHDGKKLAVSIGDPGGDLWVYDLPRGVRTRYTFGSKVQRSPVWSPDDKQIASLENEQNTANIVVWSASSAGTYTPLYQSPTVKRPTDYSPDGKYLMFSETPVGTGLYLLPLTGEKKPQEFREKRINANDGQFSPDGKWVVYSSQETGRTEIFVTQFPGPRGQWQVSNAGGSEPRWRKDGKAIYYWGADRNLTEAEVEAKDGRFEVNAIRPLFKVLMPVNPIAEPTYDVTGDGKKFIVNTASSAADQPLTVVTNWNSREKK